MTSAEEFGASLAAVKTFHELVLKTTAFYGNKIAIINADDESDKATYNEIQETALKVANFLADRIKLKKQQTAAIVLPNCWEHLAIHTGISLVGGIMTSVSSHFTNFEIAHQLKNSDTVVVFVDSKYIQKILSIAAECPKLKYVVVLGDSPRKVYSRTFISYPWHAINDHFREFPQKYPVVDPKEDICWLPYSSGTTGLPKGVMITHDNYVTHFKCMVHFLANRFGKNVVLDEPSEYSVNFSPIYHAMGYNSLMVSFVRGSAQVWMKKFTLKRMLELVEKYRPDSLGGAPTVVQQLVRNPIAKNYNLDSIKIMRTGGAKLDEGSMKIVLERFPNVQNMSQGYGMTEAVTVLVASTGLKTEPLDCTGVPITDVDVKICDPKTDSHLPANSLGELRFKAPYTMKGYWKNPEATRACYDKNGYFKTGDIAYIDDNGFVFIKDRIKELIKVRAFQVPPAEIEAVLLTHPLVSDCGVIGIPSDTDGEVPKAFVVRSSKTLTKKEVQAHVAERLSHYKHLKGGVQFIDEIPRTASGKIMRRYLKEREMTHRKSKL